MAPPHVNLSYFPPVSQVTAPSDAYSKEGRLVRDLREEEVSLEFLVQYKDLPG